MSGKTILILGGARSGKTAFAERCASDFSSVVYFATAAAGDEEMIERIKRHQADRPVGWRTVEAQERLADAFMREAEGADAAIVDCLTVYVSNLMALEMGEEEILSEAISLSSACRHYDGTTFIVSNEVGLGIVPENKLARFYRDLLGKFNQAIAKDADEVYLLAAGIPLKMKG